jgi:uncharacterized phage protein (TIGR01671 family)
MKREIKFRAWDVKNQQMIAPTESGLSIEMYLDGSFAVMQLNEDNGKWYDREGDDFELMQYTGLKDKNGVEIYEGDIIKITWQTYSTGGYFQSDDAYCEHEHITTVEYNKLAFVFKSKNEKVFMIPKKSDIEVIGNIYENPELL